MFQDLPPAPPAAVTAIEVQPARLPPAASDAAFSVIQLDPDQIEGKDRLDQALTRVPGVSLFRRTDSVAANPTTQGLSLRSIAPSGAGRALITLDGVPQNDPFGGWVIWESLPSELVDGVSVVRGGGAGPYGAGALTGVVSINERAQDGVIADARYGSLDAARGSVVAEGHLGAFDLLAAGSGETSDGFIPVRQGRGAADTKLWLHSWNSALRANAEVGGGVLSARVGAFDDRRGSGIGAGSADSSGQTGSLTWARSPTSSTLGFRLQGWVRASDLYNSTYSTSGVRAVATLSNIQYETPATGYGFNGAVRGAGAHTEWEVGADVRSTQGEDREYIGPLVAGVLSKQRIAGGDELVAGVYAEGAEKLDGGLLLTGGVRADYWSESNAHRIESVRSSGAVTLNLPSPDRDGWVPTARAGLRKNLDDGLYLRTAAYAGFRPPTLNELHRPFRVGNDITEANPGLVPEKLYGAEAAIGHDGQVFSGSATLFYNQVNDPVTNVTIGVGTGAVIPALPQGGVIPAGGTLRQRQNAGEIDAWGVEGEADWRWTSTFVVRAAASYTDAKVDGGTSAPQLTGLRPAQAPRFTATAGFDWKPVPRLTVLADARYESMRFDDDINTRILPAGGMANLRVSWAATKSVEIYAMAENLFDSKLITARASDNTPSYASPQTFSIGLTLRH